MTLTTSISVLKNSGFRFCYEAFFYKKFLCLQLDVTFTITMIIFDDPATPIIHTKAQDNNNTEGSMNMAFPDKYKKLKNCESHGYCFQLAECFVRFRQKI